MTDMSQFIAPKSDQINADDLVAGPRTITITRVSANESAQDQPINVFFDGDNGKPFRPCKSMRRVMVSVWGADANQYIGRSMTLYRDPEVMFGGMKVGGIRISHMSHIEREVTMALTATRAKRAPFTVKPLRVAPEMSDAEVKSILDDAERAASQGTEAFREWFKGKSDAERAPIRKEIAHFQKVATEADAKTEGADDEDPFDDPRPTEEELAAAEAAAREAAKAQEG
jgi:hypothetical protein